MLNILTPHGMDLRVNLLLDKRGTYTRKLWDRGFCRISSSQAAWDTSIARIILWWKNGFRRQQLVVNICYVTFLVYFLTTPLGASCDLIKHVRPFCMRDFSLEVANRVFFSLSSSFLPRKERISSRAFSEWVRLLSERGTQSSFPLLDCRSGEKFGLLIAHFSIFLLEKQVIKQSPLFLSSVSFLTTQLTNQQLKNQLFTVRNSRNCDNRAAGNWSGYLSESSRQTHSEKSRLDFLSLRGNN